MADIVFVHTAPALVAVFERLVAEAGAGYTARHVLRDDLLKRAVQQGEATPEILKEAAAVLVSEAEARPSAVVCTCSTIGEAVDLAGPDAAAPVFRIDQAMAARALAIGRRIHVMATLATTIGPTLRLLESEAAKVPVTAVLTSEVVAGAGSLLMEGRKEEYISRVAAAIGSAAANCDVVVLAQASMAEAARHAAAGVPVLSSPEIGVASLLGRLEGAAAQR